MTRMMVMWEARVPEERWADLRLAYDEGMRELPTQMAEHFLVQDVHDRETWRIVSIWHSAEGLDEYRKSTATPGGMAMFRSAGAEAESWISAIEVFGYGP